MNVPTDYAQWLQWVQCPQPMNDLPILTDIDDSLLALSDGSSVSSNHSCHLDSYLITPTKDLLDMYLPADYDHSLSGPLTSTLDKPLNQVFAKLEALLPPVSPIRHGTYKLSPMKPKIYEGISKFGNLSSPREDGQLSFSWKANSYGSDEELSLTSSHTTIHSTAIPNTSLWVPHIPVAFSTYQEPTPHSAIVKGSTPRQRLATYLCKFCGKRYKSEHAFKIHTRLHTDNIVDDNGFYVCKICERSFNSSYDLKRHSKTPHTNGAKTKAKKCVCNRCNNIFNNHNNLVVHMITEVCIPTERCIRRTGKGWDCNNCESGPFESREMAEAHTHQHESSNVLLCPVCSTSYDKQKKGALVKHVKDCHPEYMASLGI